MAKETTKIRILQEGARIVYENGYNNTGIQEILDAAGVPKGSFYFYFKSKEDFGLHLVDFYMDAVVSALDAHAGMERENPITHLRNFFRLMMVRCEEKGCKGGCPIGNLTQEMADLKESFRVKLNEAFSRMSKGVATCLEQAQRMNQLDPALDPRATADFILNSWEGALLRMKAQGSSEPLVVFDTMVFDGLLKR
jgi:TetR/AcrR family transcriptional regulator, transcriptional repressor for nem operon